MMRETRKGLSLYQIFPQKTIKYAPFVFSIRAKFIRIHRDLEQDGIEHITAEAVVSRFLGRDKPERYTLLEVFREHNEPFHSKNTKKLKYNKFEFHIFTL